MDTWALREICIYGSRVSESGLCLCLKKQGNYSTSWPYGDLGKVKFRFKISGPITFSSLSEEFTLVCNVALALISGAGSGEDYHSIV